MLNLDSRTDILGITVFQDADQPNQFYYLPGAPHITHDRGQPVFDLFSYRKGGTAGQDVAGGFLNMSVDLSLGGLRDRIEARLKELHGDGVTLASVPFTKGTARVIALGEDSAALQGGVENETTPAGNPLVARGPRFIENILGPGRPSLDGDNRAIFSFSLTEDGAAFFLGVLGGAVNARPVGVVYDLTYVGLLPAYDLEITIDFKSSYEYLRTRFTLGTLFFKADIDNIIEELQRRESIKIKEVARTLELSKPEAIAERQSRINALVKDLASGALFQPSLTPGEPRVKGDTVTATDPTTAATSSGAQSSAAAALAHGPTAATATGMGEALARHERIGAPAGQQPTGTTTGGTTTSPTTTGTQQPAQTATDVWNNLGRPQAAFALKQIRQEEQRTVTYNLSQVSAQEQTVAPQAFIQFLASVHDLNDHVHIVDLNHPFFQRININVNARDVDFDQTGIVQMVVQLRYGRRPDGSAPKDTAEVILRSPDDSLDVVFFTDREQRQWYEYKLIVDYRNDFGIGVKTSRVEGPWTRTEARSLTAHPNWLGRTLPVMIQLAPNLPADVSQVQALVRYVNPARQIDDSILVQLDQTKRSQQIFIRLADENEQFTVTSKLFYSDGTSEELPVLQLPDPTTGASDDVVVLSAPPASRLNADVLMLDPFGQLESVLVDTEVRQDGTLLDARSLELTVPGKREIITVRLPRRDLPARLQYRERRILKGGAGLEVDDWTEPVSRNIVVGIPSAGLYTVTIRFIGPAPSSLGLDAILLDLEYADPGGDPKFSQQTSKLITDDAGSFTQDWTIRLANREAKTYRWKLTLLNKDGTTSTGEFNSDTRQHLLLRPRL